MPKVIIVGTDKLSNLLARATRAIETETYEVLRYEKKPPDDLDISDIEAVIVTGKAFKEAVE